MTITSGSYSVGTHYDPPEDHQRIRSSGLRRELPENAGANPPVATTTPACAVNVDR
jgi:hypothetical protein